MSRKIYKYRVKTEEEFINEYGIHWQSKITCGWDRCMNIFFGQDIEIENIEPLKRNYSSIQNYKWFIHYRGWSISCDMVVKNIIKPTYKPKKIERKI